MGGLRADGPGEWWKPTQKDLSGPSATLPPRPIKAGFAAFAYHIDLGVDCP